jgi:hypothetical protein
VIRLSELESHPDEYRDQDHDSPNQVHDGEEIAETADYEAEDVQGAEGHEYRNSGMERTLGLVHEIVARNEARVDPVPVPADPVRRPFGGSDQSFAGALEDRWYEKDTHHQECHDHWCEGFRAHQNRMGTGSTTVRHFSGIAVIPSRAATIPPTMAARVSASPPASDGVADRPFEIVQVAECDPEGESDGSEQVTFDRRPRDGRALLRPIARLR